MKTEKKRAPARKLEKITARGADGLYRDVISKIIYFREYKKGRGEVKVSTRTTNVEDAKRFRDEKRRAWNQTTNKAKQTRTALELYDLWVIRAEALNKSQATVTSMKATRNFLSSYIGTMLPDEMTAVWWETKFIPETKFLRFKTERKEGKKVQTQLKRTTPRKFYNDWKWTSSFLKQLVADGVIQKQPKLVNPDPERDPGRVFTDQEIETLLGNAQTDNLYLAILMAITMGMRRSEIFMLQADRVDLEKGMIRLRAEDTKIRKGRSFAISPDTLAGITERVQSGAKWIFPASDDPEKPVHKDGYMGAWRRLKERTGIEGRFHFLRHTFLTKAFRTKGSNAALICHYAGLSLEEAQKTYLHFTDEDTFEVAGLVRYET
jgi:integrase